MDSIEPPESDSNDISSEELICRGVKDENNERCLFLLNPAKYPPSEEGFKFLNDLKCAAGPENYTTQAKRTGKTGKNGHTQMSINCTHSKSKDKCVRAHGDLNISSNDYRNEKINNTRRCSRGDGRSLARRSTTQYSQTPCQFKNINVYVGKKCLFLIPSDDDGKQHKDHPQFDIKDKNAYVSDEMKKTIVTVAAGRASGFNVLKATQKLHAGGMNLSKGQASHHSKEIRTKAKVSDTAVPQCHWNDVIGVSKLLQCYECHVLMLQYKDGYNPVSTLRPAVTNQTPVSGSMLDSFINESITRTSSAAVTNEDMCEWIKSVSPHTQSSHAIVERGGRLEKIFPNDVDYFKGLFLNQ